MLFETGNWISKCAGKQLRNFRHRNCLLQTQIYKKKKKLSFFLFCFQQWCCPHMTALWWSHLSGSMIKEPELHMGPQNSYPSGPHKQQIPNLNKQMCLSARQIYRARGWETQLPPGLLHKWPSTTGLVRIKARSFISIAEVDMGGRTPSAWAIFSSFPRYVSKEVDWKCSNQHS